PLQRIVIRVGNHRRVLAMIVPVVFGNLLRQPLQLGGGFFQREVFDGNRSEIRSGHGGRGFRAGQDERIRRAGSLRVHSVAETASDESVEAIGDKPIRAAAVASMSGATARPKSLARSRARSPASWSVRVVFWPSCTTVTAVLKALTRPVGVSRFKVRLAGNTAFSQRAQTKFAASRS